MTTTTMRAKRLLWLLALLVLAGCPVYPAPGPSPEPEPSPLPVASLKVLVVEESAERHKLTRGQLNVLSSTAMRERVKALGGEFLVLDQHAEIDKADDWVRAAMALDRESLPWMIVAGPKGAWVGPLPDSTDAVIQRAEEVK